MTDTNCQRASQSLYETIAVSLFARLPPRALLAASPLARDSCSATFPRGFSSKRETTIFLVSVKAAPMISIKYRYSREKSVNWIPFDTAYLFPCVSIAHSHVVGATPVLLLLPRLMLQHFEGKIFNFLIAL